MLMGKVNSLTLTERVTLGIGRRGNFMAKEPILHQMKESTKENSRVEIEMVLE